MDNKDAMSKEEEKKVTDRINELYHKKEKEGLTPEEEAERNAPVLPPPGWRRLSPPPTSR